MIDLDSRARCTPIDVPTNVAKCPICDAPIVIEEVGEWETEGGKPIGISLECTTMPGFEDDDWDEWHREHWSHPYMDWMPLEDQVMEWFQTNYRCV